MKSETRRHTPAPPKPIGLSYEVILIFTVRIITTTQTNLPHL
jgi:hypothetical protein